MLKRVLGFLRNLGDADNLKQAMVFVPLFAIYAYVGAEFVTWFGVTMNGMTGLLGYVGLIVGVLIWIAGVLIWTSPLITYLAIDRKRQAKQLEKPTGWIDKIEKELRKTKHI